MTLTEQRNRLPAYAKDLKLNLDSVLSTGGSPGLDGRQIRAIALASALASRNPGFAASVEAFAAEELDDQAIEGARAAAAIMAMNNIYYRAVHLVGNDEYAQLRTGLRMNVMANPGLDKAGFELASLAVSAINGCGSCIASHEKTLRAHGVGAQGVQSALKIAAVVHAVAVVLEQQAD